MSSKYYAGLRWFRNFIMINKNIGFIGIGNVGEKLANNILLSSI